MTALLKELQNQSARRHICVEPCKCDINRALVLDLRDAHCSATPQGCQHTEDFVVPRGAENPSALLQDS